MAQIVELGATSTITSASAACCDAGLGLYLLRFTLHPSEADEHLLECSLTDRIDFDVVRGASALHGAEQVRPRHSRRPPDTVVHKPAVLVFQLAAGEGRADKL